MTNGVEFNEKEFQKKLNKWKNEVYIFVKGLLIRDNMSIQEMAELFKYCFYIQVVADPRYPTLKEKEKIFYEYYQNLVQNLHDDMNKGRFKDLK